MRILIIGGISKSLINFRGPLIKAMQAQGHSIVACAGTPDQQAIDTLLQWGIPFTPIPLARAGMNPIGDLHTFRALRRVMQKHKPDVVLAYTIKPIVWGVLAARSLGIKNMYGMVEGLGRAFMPIESVAHWLSSVIAKLLYRISLPLTAKTFFLNPDDLNQFTRQRYISADKAILLNGIGIDLDWHSSEPPQQQTHTFLMIARLLADKGVREYAAAAKILKSSTTKEFKCILLGDLDENPSSISKEELDSWIKEGIIDYRGYASDVRPFLQACSVYVLPSYREGTPRTVLEAMATGRAIITTDAPGCRETVRGKVESRKSKVEIIQTEDGTKVESRKSKVEIAGETEDGFCSGSLPANNTNDTNPLEKYSCDSCNSRATREAVTEKLQFGVNGILIPPRDAGALAEAMRFFIEQPGEVERMGRESRRYAEARYDVRKVNAVMLREMVG